MSGHGCCAICSKHDYLMPLHGDKGGPGCCLLCMGEWHAEQGRRRRLGRIAIRAMNAYIEGGGKFDDFDKLKLSVSEGLGFGLDPLGYLADTARTSGETIELTSELRMLVSFVNGTRGTYSGGLVLTPHGEPIARLLVNRDGEARTFLAVTPRSPDRVS